MIDDTNWHHIAGTRDASSGALKLYINGQWEASSLTGPAWTTDIDRLYIGATNVRDAGPEDGKYFTGQIDDVQLFDFVLSQDEVRIYP